MGGKVRGKRRRIGETGRRKLRKEGKMESNETGGGEDTNGGKEETEEVQEEEKVGDNDREERTRKNICIIERNKVMERLQRGIKLRHRDGVKKYD